MKRRYFFLISFLVFLLLTAAYSAGALTHLQRTFSDRVYGGGQASEDIVIVAIDDPSLQEIGRWPWDRGVFANIISNLAQSDVKVIGIDVGFFEPSDTQNDENLSRAIGAAGNVVLAMEYTDFSVNANTITGTNTLLPIQNLRDAANGLGYINVVTDRDGVTRAYNTNVQGEYPSFAEAIALRGYDKSVERSNRLLINFAGPPNSYDLVSAKDVLNNNSPVDMAGKVVLIGATSPDLRDTFFVPTSNGVAMPGVEIMANAVQSIVLENMLREQSRTSVILFIAAICLLFAIGFSLAGIRVMMIVSGSLIVLYLGYAIIMFERNVIVNIVFPILAIIVSFTSNLGYAYVARKHQRDQAITAFSKYVSKDVVNQMLANPDKLKLGGERRIITVFFSDIRGFTSVSEALGPVKLVKLLNEYLTEMTDIVIEANGTVDKYMGDAIMAFWGAPIDQPDHAVRACDVSLKMMKRLRELQKKWTAEGVPPLDIGIGLNTGDAIVGNMGSTQRFDYTAMGDTVNLGSRLEGVNKPYKTHILISESTQREVQHKFTTRMIDRIRVKGRDAPLIMYELVDYKEKTTKKTMRLIELFEKGLQLYFNNSFKHAIKEFEEALKIDPNDGPSKVFMDRCKLYLQSPPPKDWGGVYTMKTK